MKRLVLLVLFVSATAAAAAPIGISASGPATVDHVDLALHRGEDRTEGLMYLTLSTQETAGVLATVTFTLPHGTRVTAMSFRTSEGLRSLAQPLSPGVAERALRARMLPRHPRDPALLEQVKTSRSRDTYALRVFPLVSGASPIVEIAFELSAELEATPSLVSGLESSRVSVAAFEDGWAPFARPALVDRKTVLYADDPQSVAGRISVELVSDEQDGITGIRARIRSHLRELETCFAGETANFGSVSLNLVVVPGGRVSSVGVGGAGQDTNDCVTKQIGELTFPRAPDELTAVSYPVFWLRS